MTVTGGFGARLALCALFLGVISNVIFVVDASSASAGLSETELLSQLPPQTTMVDLLKRVRELTRERDECRSSLRDLKDGKQRHQGEPRIMPTVPRTRLILPRARNPHGLASFVDHKPFPRILERSQ